LLTKIKER